MKVVGAKTQLSKTQRVKSVQFVKSVKIPGGSPNYSLVVGRVAKLELIDNTLLFIETKSGAIVIVPLTNISQLIMDENGETEQTESGSDS